MRKQLGTFVITLFMSSYAFAQGITAQIDSIVQATYQKYQDVSMSVGVIQNGKEYYTSYGKLSQSSNRNVNKKTVFEIASITKPITGNLIAIAANERKLELTDYIEEHLPKDFVVQEQLRGKVMISDLASHQSGLDDIDFMKLIEKNPQNPMEGVERETFAKLLSNCSELKDYGQYRYSTIGFVLLGEILENVYDKSYDEILREKIINPLKMTSTYTQSYDIKNIATGYNRDGGKQNLMPWNVSAPAGLIKSSASDMVKYIQGLLDGNAEISNGAITSEKIVYKEKQGLRKIGLGINVYMDDSNTYFQKTGDIMGQSSVMCYNREKNWGVIILINQRNGTIRKELWNSIYNLVLK